MENELSNIECRLFTHVPLTELTFFGCFFELPKRVYKNNKIRNVPLNMSDIVLFFKPQFNVDFIVVLLELVFFLSFDNDNLFVDDWNRLDVVVDEDDVFDDKAKKKQLNEN